jgi:hypothetical protein
MSHFLPNLPIWQLVLVVIVIPTAIAIGIQALVRRLIGVDRLVLNNEVAGFIFAIIDLCGAARLRRHCGLGEIQRRADFRGTRIRRRGSPVTLRRRRGAGGRQAP